MIDELEIKSFDARFGTRSKVFQCTNTIVIETPLDSWIVKVTNRQTRPLCLLHKNKFGRINKYHIQSWKTKMFHVYDSIYKHKGMHLVGAPNTYKGSQIK
mgnify:CR=1 FL=1|jgi:hypothetical protein